MNSDKQEFTIALSGNPNSGKTTIFNNLTGANQHVGNYPGVTVEKKEGYSNFDGHRYKLVDLPGTYSLSAYSIEEIIARNYIIKEKPDVVVDVVDATNIERNLYLTTQIIELGIPVVIALNMSDMTHSRGIQIDTKLLSQLLGVPIIPTIGSKRKGMDNLMRAVIETVRNGKKNNPIEINYGREFETELTRIEKSLDNYTAITNGYRPRWLALKILENDKEIISHFENSVSDLEFYQAIDKSRNNIETLFGDETAAVVSDRRYAYISGACAEAITLTGTNRHDISDKIDLALIHPVLGLPIFGFLIWLMFNLTFTLSEYPMDWIESGISLLSGWLQSTLPDGLLSSLIVDGIIGGVGGVIVFLPNIMMLFLCIALLEDSGYMARAAFIMDRIMHKIGLHGKSFIPMIIGFGCSVPAYMGSRILEDKTDRLVTLHVTTFMSCGARLPVYILICGAFWPENAGNVVFSIYVLGIIIAIAMVKILRTFRFKGMSAPFIMELPPYRVPTLRSLSIHMWERSWLYLRKAGTVILGISIIMWFLMTFPRTDTFSHDYDSLAEEAVSQQEIGNLTGDELETTLTGFQNIKASEQLSNSFAGKIGKTVEPVIAPLGFDWRLGIALVSCFAAKEVVVSTMGTIYGVGEAGEESTSLRQKLAHDPAYSKLIAYAFVVFILLYTPCMAALAVFLRESGSWKELFYQIIYTFSLAYGLALIVYQGGRLLGLN
ncbi:MAG: ferrous iron transport protein B [candidate division Zixibacteria bacterium]